MNPMVVLNVGLWVNGVRPDTATLAARTGAVFGFVKDFLDAGGSFIEGAPATDDGSREDTLVVVFEGARGWQQHVYELAEITGQDCIAAWVVPPPGTETPRGYLIGPRHELWQPFAHDKFIHPTARAI